jgi:hypothetical protein
MVMVKRQIFSVLIIFFLLPGILINGIMTEVCLCIEPCSFGLQNELDTKESSPFHSHHANAHCKSCNVEDGQTLKAANISSCDSNLKIFDTAWIASVLVYYPTTNRYRMSIGSTFTAVKVLSSPIYLKNLSFLF